MCMSAPSMNTSAIVEAQKEQLNKANAVLSNEKTAGTTGEKTAKKRTVNSLRVPLKGKNDTSTTGVNTTDTAAGLNIPV